MLNGNGLSRRYYVSRLAGTSVALIIYARNKAFYIPNYNRTHIVLSTFNDEEDIRDGLRKCEPDTSVNSVSKITS